MFLVMILISKEKLLVRLKQKRGRKMLGTLAKATIISMIALGTTLPAYAEDVVGRVKTLEGRVDIYRGVETIRASLGEKLMESDRIETGENGSVGITFADSSLLSLGPGSSMDLQRFSFNSTTHDGVFNTKINKGTLSVVSGKIAKRKRDAMTVRTPTTILGVRGTRFLVKVN